MDWLTISIFMIHFCYSLPNIIDHICELEEKNVVVIHNVLSNWILQYARENAEALSLQMDVSSNIKSYPYERTTRSTAIT